MTRPRRVATPEQKLRERIRKQDARRRGAAKSYYKPRRTSQSHPPIDWDAAINRLRKLLEGTA